MLYSLNCKFHYKYIRRKFNADLLFTDIGSLIYEIKTDDVYEDFYIDKNSFGFSDYLGDSKFFDFIEKKVIIKILSLILLSLLF